MHDIQSYEEEVQTFTTKEAIREANRCQNCKKPQCQKGCPISNEISAFIAALGRGNMGEAREIISRKSNLPAVCGRVCAHELQCEGHCILASEGKGIRIGMLERFVADYAFQMEIPLDKIPQKTRGKVAVIGSGPAGLTVAGDLAKMGFGVTVYEALPEPGGLLLYGIPQFRLPKEVVRREIMCIEALGVNFVVNCIVGRDVTVDSLFAMGMDAVFIGSGTAVAKELDLPGKDLGGVIQSSYLLRMNYLYNSGQIRREEVPVYPGDKVYIVGCGNAAMDAARTLARLGISDITVTHRGTLDTMSALKAEYEAAVRDGVQFLWETLPIAFEGKKELSALRVNTPRGEQVLAANRVFLAIGSRPANRIISTASDIEVDAKGYVISKQRPYGMTTRKGVFAGGDVVHKPATVVLAMKEAKKVAAGIAEYVDAVKLLAL